MSSDAPAARTPVNPSGETAPSPADSRLDPPGPPAPEPLTPGGETAAVPAAAPPRDWRDRALRGLLRHEEEREPVPTPPPMARSSGAPAPRAAPAPEKTLRLAPGGALGRYRLGRQLGRGGMGAVFEAEDPLLGRRVAIKVLLGGRPELLERFQVEARAVARLRHPNIVGLHEVGQEGEDHYLVMELVEGESLAARLKRDGPLPPRDAARLFAQLADALYAAHGRSILHRDLKPANILLEKDGRPLLGDFGLAKEVERAGDGPTETGQIMGTPVYMSPEQAQGHHDRLDRRTDIYSLGVTLFEALTGRLPFEQGGVHALLRAIIEEEPPPPGRLRPGLDRDLETICLHCLEKEPERRYASAAELAEDLRRWLRDEPIAARRPGPGERLGKWVRRNRAVAGTLGATLGAALIVIAAGTALFLQRLRGERDRATALAHEAAASARETRAALDFLVREVQDELQDVPGERVRAARARLLQEATRRMLALEEREGVNAETLSRSVEAYRLIGELALEAGDTTRAGEAAGRSVELARRLVASGAGPQGEQCLMAALHGLAEVAAARNDPDRELALVQEALPLAERAATARPDDLEAQERLAICLRDVGDALERRRALGPAREHHERALALRRAVCARGETPYRLRAVVESLNEVAQARERQGELAAAAALLDEAVALERRVLALDPANGTAQRDLAQTLAWIGQNRLGRGDVAGAAAAHEEALAIRRRLLALDPSGLLSRRGVAASLLDVARVADERRQRDAALAACREAAGLFRDLRALDPSDLTTLDHLASALQRVAEQLRERGEQEPARATAREVVALQREHVARAGEENANARRGLAYGLVELGVVERGAGDARASRAALEEGLQHLRRALALSPDEARVADQLARGLMELGLTLEALGEPPPARRAAFEEGLRLARERLAREGSDVRARRDVGTLLLLLGELDPGAPDRLARLEEAERVYRDLLTKEPDGQGDRHNLAVILQRLGQVRKEGPDPAAAIPFYEEAVGHFRRLAESNPDAAQGRAELRLALEALGGALRSAGDARASEVYREAVSLAPPRAATSAPPRELMMSFIADASAAYDRGDMELAGKSYEEALRLARERHAALPDDGGARRDLSVILLKLSQVRRTQGDPATGVELLAEAVAVHAVLAQALPDKYTAEHATFEGILEEARRHLALLREEVEPASPAEAITQAQLFFTAKDPAGAVRAYRKALASEAVRGDGQAQTLYHAACAAALAAAAEQDPARRDAFAAEALAWLQDDLRRLRARLAEAEQAPAGPQRDARAAGARKDLEDRRELLRRDEDLASLRARPGFAALLE